MGEQASEVQDIGIFSDRSPSSKTQESKLRGELEKINRYVSRLEGQLADLEANRSRMIRLMALGEIHSLSQSNLDECVRLIHDTRDNLEALGKERAKTEQEIANLYPTPAQSDARRALQLQFTELAKKRFAKTQQVQTLLRQLREVLDERIELAGEMRKAALELDCQISGDALDERRFDELLSALPDDVLGASERWMSGLDLTPYLPSNS